MELLGGLYNALDRSSPFLDKMIQPRDRLRVLQVLRQRPFSPSESSCELLRESLVFSELDEERLVQEVLDILVIVERGGGGGSLVRAFLVQRLPRVDACHIDQSKNWTVARGHTFEDAEASEIAEGDLKLFQCLISSGVILGPARVSMILLRLLIEQLLTRRTRPSS